jgi:hypothetical protein
MKKNMKMMREKMAGEYAERVRWGPAPPRALH